MCIVWDCHMHQEPQCLCFMGLPQLSLGIEYKCWQCTQKMSTIALPRPRSLLSKMFVAWRLLPYNFTNCTKPLFIHLCANSHLARLTVYSRHAKLPGGAASPSEDLDCWIPLSFCPSLPRSCAAGTAKGSGLLSSLTMIYTVDFT